MRLLKLPVYAVGGCVWVYNSESTIRQGARSGTDDKVLKIKLSLLWTGPFKILAVGPCADAPNNKPLASKLYTWTFRRNCLAKIPNVAFRSRAAILVPTRRTPSICPGFYVLASPLTF